MDRRAALDWAARALQDMGIEEARREARLLLEHCAGPAAGDGELLRPGADRRTRRTDRAPPQPRAGIADPRPMGILEPAVLRDVGDIDAAAELGNAGAGGARSAARPRSALAAAGSWHRQRLPAAGAAARTAGGPRSGYGQEVPRRSLSHNATRQALGLADRARFALGDWTQGVTDSFDLIVSNPPYIRQDGNLRADAGGVARYEPRIALDGGRDGLDCYRQLAPQIAARLEPGGLALLEVGLGQSVNAAAILAAAGLRPARVKADLGGRERCIIFRNDK